MAVSVAVKYADRLTALSLQVSVGEGTIAQFSAPASPAPCCDFLIEHLYYEESKDSYFPVGLRFRLGAGIAGLEA